MVNEIAFFFYKNLQMVNEIACFFYLKNITLLCQKGGGVVLMSLYKSCFDELFLEPIVISVDKLPRNIQY